MGIHSGLDHVVTLEMAQKLLSHPNIRKKAEKAQKLLEDGVIFEDALSESGLFEGLNARLITVGLRTGTADEVMSKLAIRYREMALTITFFLSQNLPSLSSFLSWSDWFFSLL